MVVVVIGAATDSFADVFFEGFPALVEALSFFSDLVVTSSFFEVFTATPSFLEALTDSFTAESLVSLILDTFIVLATFTGLESSSISISTSDLTALAVLVDFFSFELTASVFLGP